jgi:hypothetical protein
MTDVSKPNVARIYDYLLGGSNNFPADRAAADEVVRLQPLAVRSVRENRGFLIRAARHLAAEEGIRQFLDIGAGLPTMNNVHQVVRQVAPDARVAYVDRDPEVVKHSEGLIDGTDGVGIIEADFRNPASILEHPVTQGLLDFSRPVGLFLVSILHFIPGADRPHELVRRYLSALPPGSHLALSHASVPARAVRTGEAMQEYNARTDGALTLRPPEQISAFFDGLRILAPGVVNVASWRPDPRQPDADTAAYDETEGGYLGGIGRLYAAPGVI